MTTTSTQVDTLPERLAELEELLKREPDKVERHKIKREYNAVWEQLHEPWRKCA